MNLFDLLLALVIGSSIISGFMSGFARTGIGFIAVIVGILGGFWFYDIPAGWFGALTNQKTAANLLGFFLIFFAAVLAGIVVGRLVSTVFKWTGLGIFDRLAGAAFGFVRGSFAVVALVAMLVAFTPKPIPNWMTGSVLLSYALGASNAAASLAPQVLKDSFAQSMKEIKLSWAAEVDKARDHLPSLTPTTPPKVEEPVNLKPAPERPATKSKAVKSKAGKGKAVKVPKSPPPAVVAQ
ncbi:MAG: CvpA family protein [Acidobacteriota bacterium]